MPCPFRHPSTKPVPCWTHSQFGGFPPYNLPPPHFNHQAMHPQVHNPPPPHSNLQTMHPQVHNLPLPHSYQQPMQHHSDHQLATNPLRTQPQSVNHSLLHSRVYQYPSVQGLGWGNFQPNQDLLEPGQIPEMSHSSQTRMPGIMRHYSFLNSLFTRIQSDNIHPLIRTTSSIQTEALQ